MKTILFSVALESRFVLARQQLPDLAGLSNQLDGLLKIYKYDLLNRDVHMHAIPGLIYRCAKSAAAVCPFDKGHEKQSQLRLSPDLMIHLYMHDKPSEDEQL